MGVSGCGKSMVAKAIAKAWNVPLVRLDMSLVLSGAYEPPEVAFEKEWSGAEIEQAVKSSRIDAYQEHRTFTDQDIGHNASNMVPLAQTMKEQIKEIKDWSFNRAVTASKK